MHFLFSKLGEPGMPEPQEGRLHVEMNDLSIFHATINEPIHSFTPSWMYSEVSEISSIFYLIKINNWSYGGIILPQEELPLNHDPLPDGPYYAEMRIDGHNFYTHTEFIEYNRRHSRVAPPDNHIYIQKTNGVIECAALGTTNPRRTG